MRLVYCLLILLTLHASGQTFVAEVELPEIKTKDFYRILIDPAIMVYASSDLSNVRILDSNNREVPYVTGIETPVFTAPQFKPYFIVSKTLEKDCCTRLVLENPSRKPINNISLFIKNADTHKEATLLGSDDRKTWYALKENFYLDAINSPDQTYEIRILNFPLSNYQYLGLNINDSSTAPINIMKAGYYESQTTEAVYSKVPILSFSFTDSIERKQTVVAIRFDPARLVDKLELKIAGQTFYHRQASLHERVFRTNKKGDQEWYMRYLQPVELTSTHSATIIVSEDKVSQLFLVIENQDNPSLQFPSVEAFQLNRYLTAWLENGKNYSLKIGDGKMAMPVYDLVFFRDSIPAQPSVLKIAELKPILHEETKGQSSSIFRNKQLIWTAIIVVAAILTFMSVKMVQESKNKA